jgi:hypothetical protein
MELIKIFLIVVALIVLIHMIPAKNDNEIVENMSIDDMTAESIQNIASLYNDKTPSFTNLTVSDTGTLRKANISNAQIGSATGRKCKYNKCQN